MHRALLNSHSVVSAWDKQRLIGIGNAISDGALVVYYPHLLIHPHYQSQGIGKEIVGLLKQRYEGVHMHILVAERDAIGFYEKCGIYPSRQHAAYVDIQGKRPQSVKAIAPCFTHIHLTLCVYT